MEYNTVQYITGQKSIVQYSALQCSAVQCNAVQCSAVQWSTVQYRMVQCNAARHQAVIMIFCPFSVEIGQKLIDKNSRKDVQCHGQNRPARAYYSINGQTYFCFFICLSQKRYFRQVFCLQENTCNKNTRFPFCQSGKRGRIPPSIQPSTSIRHLRLLTFEGPLFVA